jgi:GNAT superfamily N-acetyltransferase
MAINIQKLLKRNLHRYERYEEDIRKDFQKFSFRGLKDNGEYDYFAILHNTQFLVFFAIYLKKRLQTFFIMPIYRSIGLGSVMMEEMRKSYPDLYFFVKMENTEGIRFYEKNRFRILHKMYKWKIIKMGI